GRALFDDVSLQVNRGDRIGLVGPNGLANQPCLRSSSLMSRPITGRSRSRRTRLLDFFRRKPPPPESTRHGCDQSLLPLAAMASAFVLATFISLIFRCSVRRLMPSFFAAAVTFPFVVASACMINFFSVSRRSSGLDFSHAFAVEIAPGDAVPAVCR